MEKAKYMAPRGLAKKAEEWNEMTERNAHGECLQSIADYFAYVCPGPEKAEFMTAFELLKTINDEHRRRGYLSQIMMGTRIVLMNGIYRLISELYGEDVLNIVNGL